LNVTSRFSSSTVLSGSILLSHPSLRDANFSKTVVFLSNHSESDGTLGVILNRPLCKKLHQLDEQFKHFCLGDVNVYEGGPVDRDKLIIAAWDWKDHAESFRLYFGIDINKAESLFKECKGIKLACFLGHSGWSPGQMEEELKLESWVLSSLNLNLFEAVDSQSDCWKSALSGISDELGLMARAPDKPWTN